MVLNLIIKQMPLDIQETRRKRQETVLPYKLQRKRVYEITIPLGGPCKALKISGLRWSHFWPLAAETLATRPADILIIISAFGSETFSSPFLSSQFFSWLRKSRLQYRYRTVCTLTQGLRPYQHTSDKYFRYQVGHPSFTMCKWNFKKVLGMRWIRK